MVKPDEFGISWIDSCGEAQGDELITLDDHQLVLENKTERILQPCQANIESAISLNIVSDGEVVANAATVEWLLSDTVRPGDKHTFSIAVADWQYLADNTAKAFWQIRVQPPEGALRDLGWTSTAKRPFFYYGCCDVLKADATVFYRNVMPGIEWEDRQALRNRLAIRRTMETLREYEGYLGKLLEQVGRYPLPCRSGVVPTRVICGDAANALPEVDGWGRRFLYWSDGASYLLASGGSDQNWDKDYLTIAQEARNVGELAERACSGSSESPHMDLILTNRGMCQWFEGDD